MHAPALLTVDLAALGANYERIRAEVGPGCAVAGVVKANAYGLGLLPAAGRLYACGCREFFVATLDEALALRGGMPADIRVNVLGGVPDAKEMAARHITPVLNSPEDIALWGNGAPAILHIDTAMNRLGLSLDEAEQHFAQGTAKGLTVMSHFASADAAGDPLTQQQFEIFDKLTKKLKGARRSLANSSGVFRSRAYHLDLVRPGMAVYGLNPTPEAANPMAPVVSLHARVLQTRAVKAGETCGYNATYTFPADTATATLALGYADGFHRAFSGRASFYCNGVACPVRGRVSMDLTIIETGHLPHPPRQGDLVEILGPHQDADTLAAAIGTIGYEVLTGLGPRYQRVYTG
jgi:alanine racemase